MFSGQILQYHNKRIGAELSRVAKCNANEHVGHFRSGGSCNANFSEKQASKQNNGDLCDTQKCGSSGGHGKLASRDSWCCEFLESETRSGQIIKRLPAKSHQNARPSS